MNSFRSVQCKPVIVQNATFGKGLVVERRPDGMNVVQLPWGKACVHNQSLGTVLSSQFKRSRNDEDDTDDDESMNDEQTMTSHSVNQDHRSVRRKIEVHSRYCPSSPSSSGSSSPFQQPERMQS